VRVYLDRARELAARARFHEAVACCDEGLARVGESAELEEARKLAAGRHLRRSLLRGALAVGAALAVFVGFLYAQRRGPFGESPTPEDLTSSFSRFLSGQDFVSGLRKEKGGRELTFELRGEPWRVMIVRASVTPNNDDTGSFRGTLETRWESGGAPVTGRKGLAPELLKAGVGPRTTTARYNRYRRQWRW
jgi:hypothetical protein